MIENLRIAALLTVEAGLDTLEILSERIHIDCVISLLPEANIGNRISGYTDVMKYCKDKNLKYIQVSSYSLTEEIDVERLMREDIDVLLVLGWQRLVPEWLIKHVKIATLGGHGSAYGITGGRGRSPQNWALIMGEKSFTLSLFRIDVGVDAGNVILERTFEYSCFDSIETSYFKVSWLMAEMIFEALNCNNLDVFIGKPQHGEAYFLPKREPDDGMIDWKQNTESIYNLVRALTSPYPGAFSICDGAKVMIWKAIPFRLPVDISRYRVGEICQIFHGDCFVVKCGNDESILVQKWSSIGEWKPKKGGLFDSCNEKEIYSKIIERHYKSPLSVEQTIHPKIVEKGN
ncbi:MAG: hypothetical protein FWH52_01165 [Synergistaceae bacterium]|nr:hypothetical protein [Synergistaceae bacterium]